MSNEIFYSGLTSQSTAKIKAVKDERKKELSKTRNALLPVGEMLKAEFDKDIEKVSHIDYVALERLVNDYEVKAELLAQKRTVEILRSIQQRLNNLLRDNKE